MRVSLGGVLSVEVVSVSTQRGGVPMVHRTSRRPFIYFACVVLTGPLSACHSWRVQAIAPKQFVIRDSTQRIRVLRLNGAQVTMKRAHVQGDTLYGRPTRIDKSASDTLVAIPLTDVRAIELRQGDAGKTTGLVLGILALVAGAVLVLFAAAYAAAG